MRPDPSDPDVSTTRTQIVTIADDLFYQQGFEHTSFAHIAAAVGISRGNFYHHFKSKDEILDAVIARRLENTRSMLDAWSAAGEHPDARIRSFHHILIANRAKIMLYGCPVGSLCTELTKLDHVARPAAGRIFTLFRDWLRAQFEALGFSHEADALAMHVLSRSQGAATLASAFHDEAILRQEAEALDRWLDQQRARLGAP